MAAPLVLVVEDDPNVLALTSRYLRGAGYRVQEAEDGRAAWELLSQPGSQVQLVLTDVRMPGMNGLQLGRAVNESLADLPVLYMTGFANDLLTSFLSDDIRDTRVITKPFQPGDLVQFVSRWIPLPTSNSSESASKPA